jgi:hypothetical protein
MGMQHVDECFCGNDYGRQGAVSPCYRCGVRFSRDGGCSGRNAVYDLSLYTPHVEADFDSGETCWPAFVYVESPPHPASSRLLRCAGGMMYMYLVSALIYRCEKTTPMNDEDNAENDRMGAVQDGVRSKVKKQRPPTKDGGAAIYAGYRSNLEVRDSNFLSNTVRPYTL